MAEITAALVKELRERTGQGMMECKKALVAAGGDIEKAIDDMRASGAIKAAKKAGNIAAEGSIAVRVEGGRGVIIEVNSQTDFLALQDDFKAFVKESIDEAFEDLRRRWPNANFSRDDARVIPIAQRVFDPARWTADQPVKLVLIGTDFEVKVWETLLKIPVGRATTYQSVANHIGRPAASRAVGAAVGKNPISFVVPCHRVVGSTGALTGYHWGVPRKRAILGWEAGVIAA